MDAPVPSTPSPVVTRQRTTWGVLATLLLATALLITAVAVVDLDAVADSGWRTTALWAVGLAVLFLGIALAAVAWTADGARPGLAQPGPLATVAVLAVVGAVIVAGLAQERGGTEPEVSPAPAVVAGTGGGSGAFSEDEPLRVQDALRQDVLTEVAFPITEREVVNLELTAVGRELVAGAMGCEPADLVRNRVIGTAVGGTWVQPLVVLLPPVRPNGGSVRRCHRAVVRLPQAAGIVAPGY